MPVLTSSQGNKPIMPYVQQGQMVPMMTPQAQQMQTQLRPAAPQQQGGGMQQAAAREQQQQPDQRPQAAMVNGGEEIIPATVVQSLGGSQAITSILNSELGKRGLPPLSGDKGTVGQYAQQPTTPANMACGTVGKSMMKNYAVGTIGAPTQPKPGAGQNYTTADTQQGATNVLGTAQTAATQGFTSPTAQATSTATQNLLKAPTTKQDYVPRALEGFDVNRAKAYEAYRQKTAPISNTAGNRDEMMNLALQGAIDRSQFENQLTQEQDNTDWNRRLQALAEGRATTGTEQGIWTGNIGALSTVRGMGEGEAARQWQTGENTVGRQFEMGKLTNIQDFEREMKQVDADLAKAMQGNDIQAQKDLLDKKAYYDQNLEQVRQRWQTAERVATQGWQTGERIGTEDFQSGQSYLDRQHELAVQENDIAAQKYIENQKSMLALQMQTQDMAQEEKMAWLKYNLDDARANNDTNRQMTLMEFQTRQDIAKMVKEQGFVAAQKDLDRRLQESMQNNDIVAQYTIHKERLALDRDQMAQDKFLETARQELTARGLNMQEVESRYNAIQDAVERGQAAPSAAVDFLNSVLKTNDVTLQPPDPNAERMALDRDWNLQQYQWGMSHNDPKYVAKDERGNIVGLTQEGAAEFSRWFNENIYGNKNTDSYLTGEKPVQALVGADNPQSASYNDYQALKMRAGAFNANSRPTKGQFFTSNGRLYQVTGDPSPGGRGEVAPAVDVASGQPITVESDQMVNGRYVYGIHGQPGSGGTGTYTFTTPTTTPTQPPPANNDYNEYGPGF